MLKTNNKKVINKINEYIINNYNYDNYYTNINILNLQEGAPLEEIKKNILKIVIYEKLINYNYNIYDVLKHFYNNNFYEVFKDWAQGLPGAFHTLYYYNESAIDLVGDWLEQSETERNNYTEEEAEELASRLIFRELTKKITFNELIQGWKK